MRKNNLFIFLFTFLIFYSTRFSGQESNLDSTKCNELNKLFEYATDSEKLDYSNQLEQIASSNLKQNPKSNYFKTQLASAWILLGELYVDQGDLSKALEYCTNALKTMEELGNKKGMADALFHISGAYLSQTNYSKANEYAEKSLKLMTEIDNKKGISNCLENIGNCTEYQKNDLTSALKCYEKSLGISKEINNKKGIAYLYGNIARVNFKQGNYEAALNFNFMSLKIKEELKDKKGIGYSFHKIGQIYSKQGNTKLALEFGLKSMNVANELGYPENIKRSAELLNEVYKRQGDFKKALEMHELYIIMRDSLNNIALQKTAIQKETQFHYEQQKLKDKVEQEKKEAIIEEGKKRQTVISYSITGILALTLLFSFFLYKRFKLTNKQKHIIEIKNLETEAQKHLIEDKQKEIIESITYAKRLQEAILPPQEFINKHLPNNFVLYLPKDIVAGDFYWCEHVNDLTFIAAADSTGHGVPGAMVSVVCSNALNRSLKEFHLIETGKILDKTRELVLETFEKSTSEVKDGMDISLLCINNKNKQVFWSGANNPLWYITPAKGSESPAELVEVKANKQPIGKTENPTKFTTHEIEYKENTSFYLFTDGFADQFGGPNGKKFKYKPMAELLLKNHLLSNTEQHVELKNSFENWRGNLEQVDDVCIIGLKI